MFPIQKLNEKYAESIFITLIDRLKLKTINYWSYDISLGKEKYSFDIIDKEAILLSYKNYSDKFQKFLTELGFESFIVMNNQQLKTYYLIIKAELPYKF